MTLPALRSITAVSDTGYSVVFDTAEGSLEIMCRVSLVPVPGISPEPDLFMSGQLGDPRLIARAVLAVHRARQPQNPPPNS